MYSLQGSIIGTYESNFPLRKDTNGGKTPWWSSKLRKLRSISRKSIKRFCNTGNPLDYDDYREVQREYRKKIVRIRQGGWQDYCAGICNPSAAAKLHRVLGRNPDSRLGRVKLPGGKYAAMEEESLSHLIEAHFLGFSTASRVVLGLVIRSLMEWRLAA